ncbi:hypothetical protein ACQY1Q_15355 [Tenacibaculum sp. TC6]|uniref:hypothetical protein n=1 Tax=Tenacibaculum sp. TC6 TaxID=3423223 RepID=UPI003D362CD8
MKKLIALIMISIMIISCKEEETLRQEKTDELAVLKGEEANMLRFGSIDELKMFVSERQESETDLLDEAKEMSEAGKYNSLLMIYNLEAYEAEKLGINEKELPVVDSNDDMLLLLLNQKGEVAVENKIFRINGEFVYAYTEGFSAYIDEFLASYNGGKIKMEKGETFNYNKELTVYRHNNEVERESEARGVTSYQYFNNNYRMKAKQYNGYWLFYSSIGAKTKVEQRKKFLWWSWWKTVKTDNRLEYELSYKVESTFGFPTITLNASGHKYCYCNEANKTYDWSVGFPAAPNIYTPLKGETRHWAHWYSANPNTVSVTLVY